jgi:hypothetical protein
MSTTQEFINKLPVEECPYCRKMRSVWKEEGCEPIYLLTTKKEQKRMTEHWMTDYKEFVRKQLEATGKLRAPFRLIPCPSPEVKHDKYTEYGLLVSCHPLFDL